MLQRMDGNTTKKDVMGVNFKATDQRGTLTAPHNRVRKSGNVRKTTPETLRQDEGIRIPHSHCRAGARALCSVMTT